MSQWYKINEDGDGEQRPSIEDVLVVEPSRHDRVFSSSYPDMVERAWILTRPPPGIYIREPTVSAREMDVARAKIMGTGYGRDEPAIKFTAKLRGRTCCLPGPRHPSAPPGQVPPPQDVSSQPDEEEVEDPQPA